MAEGLRFFRILRNASLHSFGDEIGSVPICGRSLRAHQDAVLAEFGAVAEDLPGEALSGAPAVSGFYFDEDVFFTRGFVAKAIELIRRGPGSARFILGDNEFNRRFILPAGELNDQFRFIQRGSSAERVLAVPQKVFSYSLALPRQIVKEGAYAYPLCDTFAARIASPFHLLQLNIAVNLLPLARVLNAVPGWLATWMLKVRSRRHYRSLRLLNRIGKNCRIHPTAVIEGSVIEDGVSVGANSVVRLSHVGAGTNICDNATVTYSVLGRENYIASGNFVNVCMTYDEVFLIHGPYQFSIYGKGSAVMAVINCDIRLDQKTIQIPTDRGRVDSGQALLGIAYGHGAVVGGGNIIAPGRIVPNGLKIAPPEDVILLDF